VEAVKVDANDYIARHDLRQVLQDLFQRTILERPENPLEFMRSALCANTADSDAQERIAALESSLVAARRSAEESAGRLVDLERTSARDLEESAAKLASLERLTESLRETAQQREQQAKTRISTLNSEVEIERARAAAGVVAGNPGLGESALLAELERQAVKASESRLTFESELASARQRCQEVEDELSRERQERAELVKRSKERAEELAEETASKAATIQSSASATEELTAEAARLRESDRRNAAMVQSHRSQISVLEKQAREADASRRDLENRLRVAEANAQQQQFQPNKPGQAPIAPSATPFTTTMGSTTAFGSTAATAFCSTAATTATAAYKPQTGEATTMSMTAGAMNTHMLSQLMASTYAPPVNPSTYYEPREDLDDDTDPPMAAPELLVTVTGCKDKTANGTYATVGESNGLPIYRLLGAEPRYLYHSAVDPAWQGWWIAGQTGSDSYIEWFSYPKEARLPTYCKPGELGSKITEASLTREVASQIASVGSQQERAAIRKRLTEAFGPLFAKVEGHQRGMLAKTSAVVAVAHTLEAQQRAIQLLHSQLAVASQHRQAAEIHAQTMEEAFETLQLRIQAQLPGSSHIPKGAIGGTLALGTL
jgi:hypothetical protein